MPTKMMRVPKTMNEAERMNKTRCDISVGAGQKTTETCTVTAKVDTKLL